MSAVQHSWGAGWLSEVYSRVGVLGDCQRCAGWLSEVCSTVGVDVSGVLGGCQWGAGVVVSGVQHSWGAGGCCSSSGLCSQG